MAIRCAYQGLAYCCAWWHVAGSTIEHTLWAAALEGPPCGLARRISGSTGAAGRSPTSRPSG
eukprot:1050304-Alexandrium_andersonii.AAC.1